jgi:hypothetical protein
MPLSAKSFSSGTENSMAKKIGLGKGMQALVSDYGLDDTEGALRKRLGPYRRELRPRAEIPVDSILPNRYQPRKHFDAKNSPNWPSRSSFRGDYPHLGDQYRRRQV